MMSLVPVEAVSSLVEGTESNFTLDFTLDRSIYDIPRPVISETAEVRLRECDRSLSEVETGM